MVSEEILKFFHYKSMEKLDPRGGASLHPSGLSGFIYEEGHQTLLHMKYKSFGPYSFIEYKYTELNNAMATTVHYSISQCKASSGI